MTYSKGFDDGRQSVLRKNSSGCCCLFNEDDEIVELCMEHKVLMDSGIEAKKAMNDISMCLFSSRPHYETIEAILKIIEEYENKLKGGGTTAIPCESISAYNGSVSSGTTVINDDVQVSYTN